MYISTFGLIALYLGSAVSAGPTAKAGSEKVKYSAISGSDFSERGIAAYNKLEARTAITTKCAVIGTGFAAVGAVAGIASYLSQYIKSESDDNTCKTVSGNIDGVAWQYYVTTSGSKCDTTAEVKTINDAVTKSLNYMNSNAVDKGCFRMNHGGTWTGYLQVAFPGTSISSGACSSANYSVDI